MKQMSRCTTGFELASKRTRKREFLDDMNLVVPWAELVGLIELHAPKGKNGRPPFAVSTMPRIHFMQLCRMVEFHIHNNFQKYSAVSWTRVTSAQTQK